MSELIHQKLEKLSAFFNLFLRCLLLILQFQQLLQFPSNCLPMDFIDCLLLCLGVFVQIVEIRKLEELDFEKLFETHSLSQIDIQHFLYYLLNLMRNVRVFEGDRFIHDVFEESRVVIALPRQTCLHSIHRPRDIFLVVEHEVEDESEGPDVRFLIVSCPLAFFD